MKFNIVTIFPEMITRYTDESILGRAQKNNLIEVNAVNLRDFTDDARKTVDDTPYGGGAGMVMKPEPIYKALKSIDAIPFAKVDGLTKVKKVFNGSLKNKKRTVLLSPRGRQFDQRVAEEWSSLDEITFVCGRYEGVDARVSHYMVDEEVSIGPYVLAGGELGSLVMIEAVSRLVPGVLGNADSLLEETHGVGKPTISNQQLTINSEYDQYTKPADFRGWKVPDILLSGDHGKIEKWRKNRSIELSPDDPDKTHI
jgi:tRNA (guanine37-N1)-methyltransferase